MRRILMLLPLVAVLHGCIDLPNISRREPSRSSSSAPRGGSGSVAPPPAELRQCLGQLQRAEAGFAPLPDRVFGGGCSNLGTVNLVSVRSDSTNVTLSNLGPVTCTMANQFASWARYGADRAAQQILGARLARIETFGSYSCRTVAGSSRMSGHALANAIDVSAFVLADGRRISILQSWNGGTLEEQRFLRVVHASACKRFGTTLGPDYNAAHRNHLHLEADAARFCR